MTKQELTIAYLEDWVRAGAQWRLAEISRGHAVVELCTCYGEPVDRIETTAPQVIDYVRTAECQPD